MTRPRRRVGIVGAGGIAPYHVAAVRALPAAELVGVADCDVERARRLAAEHGVPIAVASLDELLAAGVDVVHVLTPPSAHAAVACAALAAGCHVLIEKPLATSVDECERIAAAAATAGRRAGVNHSLLGDPLVRDVLDAAASGRLGTPVSAEYRVHSVYPEWSDGPLPPQYREGGYPFRDLGVHGLYLLRACLGEIESLHVDFRGTGADPNLRYDEWTAIARCARGTGRITLSWAARPLHTSFEVHGTAGMRRADVGALFATGRHTWPLPDKLVRMVNVVEESVPPMTSTVRNVARVATGRLKSYQGLRNSVAAFYRALADGTRLPAELDDGREVVAWVEHGARPADVAARAAAGPARTLPAATLVTGATGTLGRALVARLRADGERVRVLARRTLPPAWRDVDLVRGDLGDATAVEEAVRGATRVFHVGAAMQGGWAEHARGTIGGTRHVVEAASRHDVPLVHVSSLSVLAVPDSRGARLTEEAPLEPAPERRGAYTRAKLAAEEIVRTAARSAAVRAVIVRPGAIVAPGADAAGLTNAIGVAGWMLLLGRTDGRLPLVHVDDVVDGLVRAAAHGPWDGTIYHLVDEGVWQRAALARQLAPASGRRVVRVPPAVAWSLAVAVEGLGRLLRRDVPLTRYRLRSLQADAEFDCTRARRTLGWVPRTGVGGERFVTEPAVGGVAHAWS